MGGATHHKADERTVVRLPREDRIRGILDAAREAFCRAGYANASISEIAVSAGVAQGTIYKFFESKHELVVAVIREWYDGMVQIFKSELPGIYGSRNKIRYIIWRHARFLLENPEMCRLCSNEVRNAGDFYQGELHELNRAYAHLLIDVLKEGVSTGELKTDVSLSIVRDMVFGAIDHHVAGAIYHGRKIDPAKTADQITGLLLQGLSAAPDVTPLDTVTARLENAANRFEAIAQNHHAAGRNS